MIEFLAVSAAVLLAVAVSGWVVSWVLLFWDRRKARDIDYANRIGDLKAMGFTEGRAPNPHVDQHRAFSGETCAHCGLSLEPNGWATINGRLVHHQDVGISCYSLATTYKHPMPCGCGIR